MTQRAALPTCVLAALLLAATLPRPGHAQGGAYGSDGTPRLSGDGSVRLGYWTHSRNLDGTENLVNGSLWANGQLAMDRFGDITTDGWVGGPMRRASLTDRSADLRGDETFRLREAYWRARSGDIEWRVGRQMFLWGRADGINPTDNLTPRDFTLLTPQDSDQRFGNLAVQARYTSGDYALFGIWQPEFQSDLIPLRQYPGLTYIYRRPDSTLGQFAAKLDHTGGSTDWSVSYFDGHDTRPDLAPGRIGLTGVEAELSNHRKRVIGADVSATLGDFVLRGEAAYTLRDDFNDFRDYFQKRSQFAVIGGAEQQVADDFFVTVQYYIQQVVNFQNPNEIANPLLRRLATYQSILANQVQAFQHGMAFRLTYDWANGVWKAEGSGTVGFTTKDYLLRGRLNYAVDDQWRVLVGFDYMNGPERSLFGYLNGSSSAHLELRRVF